MSAMTFTVYARSFFRRTCKACHAPLAFYQNVETGKWIPFNADPEILSSFHKVGDPLLRHEIRGITHFETCSSPSAFRRSDRKRAALKAKRDGTPKETLF